jgi:hypothetical protein
MRLGLASESAAPQLPNYPMPSSGLRTQSQGGAISADVSGRRCSILSATTDSVISQFLEKMTDAELQCAESSLFDFSGRRGAGFQQ